MHHSTDAEGPREAGEAKTIAKLERDVARLQRQLGDLLELHLQQAEAFNAMTRHVLGKGAPLRERHLNLVR